jgi:PPOX class probable F420-dependent enzyme
MLSDQARKFLEEVRFAVLATVGRSGLPQQTVMWYELRGDTIVMNTARGRLKDDNLRRDPRVSICVADGEQFVTLTGQATLIDDPAVTQADILSLATRYGGPERGREQMSFFQRQERISIVVPIDRAYERGF